MFAFYIILTQHKLKTNYSKLISFGYVMVHKTERIIKNNSKCNSNDGY